MSFVLSREQALRVIQVYYNVGPTFVDLAMISICYSSIVLINEQSNDQTQV